MNEIPETPVHKTIPFTDEDIPPGMRDGDPIPRWRFWWANGSPGFIFKSKHSPYNNLMVNYRPYPWTHKQKVWGITPCSIYNGLMIVVDLGWQRCLSIHYHPRAGRGTTGFEARLSERLKRKWEIDE